MTRAHARHFLSNRLTLWVWLLLCSFASVMAQNIAEITELNHPAVVNLGCEIPIEFTIKNTSSEPIVAGSWKMNFHFTNDPATVGNPELAEAELSIDMPPLVLPADQSVSYQRSIPVQWGLFDEGDIGDDISSNIVIVWGGEAIEDDQEWVIERRTSDIDVSLINTGVTDWENTEDPELVSCLETQDLPEETVDLITNTWGETIVSSCFYSYWNTPFFDVFTDSGVSHIFSIDGSYLGPAASENDLDPIFLASITSNFPTESVHLVIPSEFEETLVIFQSGNAALYFDFNGMFIPLFDFIIDDTYGEVPIEIEEFMEQSFPGDPYVSIYTGLEEGLGYEISTESGIQIIFDADYVPIYFFDPNEMFYDEVEVTTEIPDEYIEQIEDIIGSQVSFDWFYTSGYNCNGFYTVVTEDDRLFTLLPDGDFVEITTGIEETQNVKGTSVYPNPCNGVIHLDHSELIVKIEVFSLDGQLQILKKGSDIQQLRLSELRNGNYLLRTQSSSGLIDTEMITLLNLGR